jgi:integrase
MSTTLNMEALTQQLADMQATLGRLAGPAEGSSPPSAGEVDLFEWWERHIKERRYSDRVQAQYEATICHLYNRIRKCDDCGVFVLPSRRVKGCRSVSYMKRRKCPECERYTLSIPTACELNGSLLLTWVWQLIADGYSEATARRQLAQVRALLNSMFDAGFDVRAPRRMKDLPRVARRIRLVSEEDINAVYQAAAVAKIWPPVWWRTLICGLTLYGFRVGELTSIKWKGTHDREYQLREGIYFSRKPPHDELRHAGVEHPHGWLVYLPRKQAKVKPDPLILPLSEVFANHLRAVKSLKNASGQILPIADCEGNYTIREDEFRDEFKRIKAAAGITRPWTFKDLRRNCESRFARQFTPEDAKALTGHAVRDVSGQSYLDLVIRLVDQVDKFELTTIFNGDPALQPCAVCGQQARARFCSVQCTQQASCEPTPKMRSVFDQIVKRARQEFDDV